MLRLIALFNRRGSALGGGMDVREIQILPKKQNKEKKKVIYIGYKQGREERK